ncbi:30S ribosomal protein S9 [Microvenator marinus]|jgi:small subunit ribosomal protein S9|uniref:Small ribosomal subunit protein uS9 n=1 Tax=Microvenator marinus TaxID=2600177 RepID=A0A5B8XVK6_9DELT|nr:30S ribosomal protein S9 [Microvenator marinus]QED29650.1 30S ribosomal protein S9 [Microvenator marinus]
MAKIEQYHAIGRRKSARARVFLRPGSGQVIVNGASGDDYFHRETLMMIVRSPMVLTETQSQFDVIANVDGGGKSGQADAVKLGISRALTLYNLDLRGTLKKGGFLTRDARAKERKKYGQRGARARFQFSKR